MAGIVRVGVGVMVLRRMKDRTFVLMGKRKGSHGAGKWAWPGGHLEYGESIRECAFREVLEETGLSISNPRFLRVMNMKEYWPKQYLDIGLTADSFTGEPVILEPDKCSEWKWFSFDEIQRLSEENKVFATMPSMLDAYKTGKTFYDCKMA